MVEYTQYELQRAPEMRTQFLSFNTMKVYLKIRM
jgi:hypothetical protein